MCQNVQGPLRRTGEVRDEAYGSGLADDPGDGLGAVLEDVGGDHHVHTVPSPPCVGLLVDWERKKRASGERVGDDKARKALPHFIRSTKECNASTHSVQFTSVSEASLEHMEQSLACNSYERNVLFKRLVQRTHAHQKVASLFWSTLT
jgi:hypothetical protein